MRLVDAIFISTVTVAITGCAGQMPLESIAKMNEVRASAAATEAATVAPEAFALADSERNAAIASAKKGDIQGATLRSECATADYYRAFAIARRIKAEAALAAKTNQKSR